MIKPLDFALIFFGILLSMVLMEYIDTIYELPLIILPALMVALGSRIQYQRINRKGKK